MSSGGIYIYGAGENAGKVLERMKKSNISVDGFVDLFKTGILYKLPIVSPEAISGCQVMVISVQNLYACVEIYKNVKGLTNKIYWFWNCISGEDFWKDECIDITEWGQDVLPRLDIHLSDKCNLNCVGCTHFSPLFDEVGCDYETCMYDINLALKKFSGIARLNLLGGEPLLNDDLPRIIAAIRDKLPNTSMVLFTNGLLLLKVSSLVLDVIKESRIKIYISEYVPTYRMINEIEKLLDSKGICYELSGYDEKKLFNKPLSQTINSKYEKKCMSNGCISISNGKIARCPTLLYVSKLNEKFKCSFPTDGIYDLELTGLSGSMLIEKLTEKVSLCDYCIKNEIAWHTCCKERRITDFVEVV